jgi:uncharacterized protein (DUF2252 family)
MPHGLPDTGTPCICEKSLKNEKSFVNPRDRGAALARCRNLKMSQSSHAYVRGNTVQYYEWLASLKAGTLPDGPSVWICGDCHLNNLGPVANAEEHVEIQIRDLDQSVIGNPSHDLVRLGLSLASAARGSDLPGVTTAKMLEALTAGYEAAFEHEFQEGETQAPPRSIKKITRQALHASWKTFAGNPLKDIAPRIPLGPRFWPLTAEEKREIESVFGGEEMRRLATMLRSRDDDADVRLLDAAYWLKGCSSLGRLRYAVLLEVGDRKGRVDYCLMDVKGAAPAAAPRAKGATMPSDEGERVVEGARHRSPYLGKRMRALKLLGKPTFVRELMPQDLKIEIEQLTADQATAVAGFLAGVVGKAHNRQMDRGARLQWRRDLRRNRSKTMDAPGWLWRNVVDLLAGHERAYLEHCRKYALQKA